MNLNPGTILQLLERRERAIYKCSLVDTSACLEQSLDYLESVWQIAGGEVEAVTDFLFLDSNSLQMVTAAMKLKDACSLKGNL